MIKIKKMKIVIEKTADKTVEKAAQIFCEEIKKRSSISISIANVIPEDSDYIQLAESIDSVEFGNLAKPGLEGYRILTVDADYTAVHIEGADGRGCLYGIGKLLRSLKIKADEIILEESLHLSETPYSKLRGHQLGYRPKTNAYDAWTPEIYSQYIRDLAIFGANSIEILPPKTDDFEPNDLMKYDPLLMMKHLSEVCDSMNLDVWVWYPNISPNNWYPESGYDEKFMQPDNLKEQLEERKEIFSSLKRIDHIFVPGGDPGALNCEDLFVFMKMQYEILIEYHPKAKIWLSSQSFDPTDEWLSSFFEKVAEKPVWLGGVVFAPWEKDSLADFREKVPKDIPIRRYPDITHSMQAQYPVHNWDTAFALTLGRECINPRPIAQKAIHNRFKDYGVIGSLSYSEGINDDVNKFIWSGQDWNPNALVEDTLGEFARFFISPDLESDIIQGLLALESNFEGPLSINKNVDTTLMLWQEMEKIAPEKVLNNYRFEQGLLRAYYDYYIKYRLIHEMDLERMAMQILLRADELGSVIAIKKAKEILERSKTEPVYPQYKQKCWDLADKLFEHIGAQLSVTKHQAIAICRGAFMDSIDTPLNNKLFLIESLNTIAEMPTEEERMSYIRKIVERTNPGQGGYYDSFNANQSYGKLEGINPWHDDPGYLETPLIAFHANLGHDLKVRYNFDGNEQEKLIRNTASNIVPGVTSVPIEWISNATVYYSAPLIMKYKNLDKSASYTVKTMGIWGGDVRFKINGIYVDNPSQKVRGLLQKFDVPEDALDIGELTLEWKKEGNGIGPSIYEIWIIKN